MKKAVVLLIVGLVSISVAAQTSSRNDELKLEADYLLMMKDYGKALDLYLKIIRTEPGNADIKHRIGICYLNAETGKERAIPYLEEAVQKVSAKYNPNSLKEENASFEAFFTLGSAYRVSNEFDKAIEAYTKFKEYVDPGDEYNIRVADQYIRNCNLARHMQQHPVMMQTVNLGGVVNNEKPNFNAVVSADGRMLFFTSPGRQGYEIFQSVYSDSGWLAPKNLTSLLGTGKFMKTCDLSDDGLTLLLALEDPENSDIYVSRFSKGRWSKVEPLGKNINTKTQETHASFSENNSVLYFTSDRKGGEGDLDIYKSQLDAKGEWGKAVNLGPSVNTPFNEETPFVSDDGQVLYFSSEGHDGIGGYDVFKYDLKTFGSVPVNMGYPVNTTDNNLFYFPSGVGQSAYYALAGSDTYGGRDIYRISISEMPVQQEEVPAGDLAVAPETLPAFEEDTLAPPVLLAAEVPDAVPVEESVPEVLEEPSNTVLPEAETTIVSEPEPLAEVTTEEPAAEPVMAHREGSPVSARSYAIQIMALRKPADLNRFNGIKGITVTYNGDSWYRYTMGPATEPQAAEKLLSEIVAKGFHDAFIRTKSVVPNYAIQVMAVPGPVVDLAAFGNLPEISARKGEDSFCRYTTGEYESREEALADLKKVREAGYPKAFIAKIGILP